jgi:hypothetical protein
LCVARRSKGQVERRLPALGAAPDRALGDGDRLVSLEFHDAFLDALADRLAPRLADRLSPATPSESSPWMTFEEAVQYTKLPAGTFRKLSAAGTFTAHGGKRRIYHRDELDAALSRYVRRPRVPPALVGRMD